MNQVEVTVRMLNGEGEPIPKTKTFSKTFKILETKDLQAGQALNQLEQEMVTIGNDLLRRILTWRVEELDAELARARKHTSEKCRVSFDGKKNLQ